MIVWLLAVVTAGAAQRVVLFDNSDVSEFELMAPTNASGGSAHIYFTPTGTLWFRENGMPSVNATRVRDVRVPRRGSFSGISAPLRHIDRLPPLNGSDSFVIDVEYWFTLKDSLDLIRQAGHGLNQLLMLSSDEDRSDDPRGLAIEYGGGSFAPRDFTFTNWSEPRAHAWRFDSVTINGADGAPGGVLVTMFRTKLIRAGLFRLRSRFLLHQNNTPPATPTLQFDQFSLSVANNPNYTGNLILNGREPIWSVWSLANASAWLRRDPLAPPRLSLFSTRTDFDVESIVITAEPRSTALSFGSTWLQPPPTSSTSGSTLGRTATTVATSAPTAPTTPAATLTTTGAVGLTATNTTVDTLTITASDASLPSTASDQRTSVYAPNSTTTGTATLETSAESAVSIPPESAVPEDTGDAAPSPQSGLSQAAVIAIAAIVPTCVLCGVLLCVFGYKFGAVRSQKHRRAQVLSTTGMGAANFDSEFQSSRDVQNIYGAAPPMMAAAAEYEMICEGDLLPATMLNHQIYTAAPVHSAAAQSAIAAGPYDRVPAVRNVYDSTTSKLKV